VDKKNRSAARKTFLAVQHHAKPLAEMVGTVGVMATVSGFKAASGRGGSNSWNLKHPDGRVFKFRGRPSPWRIEVIRGGNQWNLFTRLDVIRWFEKYA